MSENQQGSRDWVRIVGQIEPDLYAHLVRGRIRDEESYLDREHRLPARARTFVAQIRRDLLLLDRIPLEELVRVSPPWLLSTGLAEIGVPHEMCEKLKGGAVRDLGSGRASPLTPEERDTVRLCLYRAGRARSPRGIGAPAPATDRIRGMVSSAPDEIRSLSATDLPGLPRRVQNALRTGGIRTVGELETWSDTDLKLLPQVGEKSLDDLLACLEGAIELALAEEPEPEPCP